MTEIIVPRGDTFPRSYLDTYRTSKTEHIYNELASSKSDELLLQNSMDIPVHEEIHHGHSENLLDMSCYDGPSSKDDFLDKQVLLPKPYRRKVPVYDRVDPEDSIRDIVTENDFYRFVLFKKHYDKYLHLSQQYEEARNIAYYLEEKYHEVKMERDDLIKQRDQLSKRLESSESVLREKEDEVFLQFERVVYLEEQCDKLKAEKEKYSEQKVLIEKERDNALKILQEQARESECNRRNLERARQEVVHHMTKIKNEKDYLERENDQLKEALVAERRSMGKYLIHGRRLNDNLDCIEQQVEHLKYLERSNTALTSQFHKAVQHLATCKLKKCSVCAYTKSTYRNLSPSHRKYDRKLFGCLQMPFIEMKNMIKPPPSPLHGAEGASLSEWFCHIDQATQSECSSLSLPFAELSISYMDDASDTSSFSRDVEKEDGSGFAGENRRNVRGFGSDSGFSSDVCGDLKSNATTPKGKFPMEKFCPTSTLDESDCAKLTRTKWTASFRRLIRRLKK